MARHIASQEKTKTPAAFLGLSAKEYAVLKKLSTPQKIQDFLDAMPANHEKNGETCMSPKRTLREHKAHCIEGAFLAAVALWVHGEEPYILNLKIEEHVDDADHIVTLFRQNGFWGAISKTNHAILRFRDPVYKTIRELALSYFHEYFLPKTGKKILRGYSEKINMKRFGKDWITREDGLWDIAEIIFDLPYTEIIPKKNTSLVRNATPLERKASDIPQWK